MRWRKFAALAGLAGLAGVAATGAAVARDERRRRAYSPDEVRSRLHERLAESREPDAGDTRSVDDDAR
jgi:hypothetical protein